MTKPKLTPIERMAKGHVANARDHAAERREKLAREFRPNARMEQLLELRTRDPSAFDRLGSHTRMSVGSYEIGRNAANYRVTLEQQAAGWHLESRGNSGAAQCSMYRPWRDRGRPAFTLADHARDALDLLEAAGRDRARIEADAAS